MAGLQVYWPNGLDIRLDLLTFLAVPLFLALVVAFALVVTSRHLSNVSEPLPSEQIHIQASLKTDMSKSIS